MKAEVRITEIADGLYHIYESLGVYCTLIVGRGDDFPGRPGGGSYPYAGPYRSDPPRGYRGDGIHIPGVQQEDTSLTGRINAF